MLTFPAVCYSSREKKKELSEFIPAGRNKCGHAAFIGSKCAKRFKPLSDKKVLLRLKQPEQCFYMFINKKIIDRYFKERTYLLTPGFLEKWRKCIKEMELDQKSARKFFSLSYTRLVLLDTGTGKNTVKNLQQFSKYLNLPYEIVPVGLDYFRMFLKEIILDWRLRNRKIEAQFQSAVFNDAERRNQKRFNINRTCLVEINESEMVTLKDISLGGIRLNSDRPLPADSVHIVKIFPSIKKEIHLTGTVAWLSSTQSPAGSHNYEIGIKFTEINEDSKRSLEKFFTSIA
ncbi:MAG: DUF1638 domain-containing protein [Nitrospirae bacterium]|nr:DUF1638 domain-containing protein [Nitrospirota bacterium]